MNIWKILIPIFTAPKIPILCGNRDIQLDKRNKTWREGSRRDYFLELVAALISRP
jgi:hypothetical protein